MVSLISVLLSVVSLSHIHPEDSTAIEKFTLTVKIRGLAPEGQAIVSIFNSSESFLKSPIRNEYIPLGASRSAEIVIHSLPAGVYAVSVVHDKNGDGKLATGLFGIPTEHVGFSNNAKGMLGPPSFDKACFALNHSSDIEIAVAKIRP